MCAYRPPPFTHHMATSTLTRTWGGEGGHQPRVNHMIHVVNSKYLCHCLLLMVQLNSSWSVFTCTPPQHQPCRHRGPTLLDHPPLLSPHLTCGCPTISSATSLTASRNWGQLRVGVAGRWASTPGDPRVEAARMPAGDQGVPEALGPTWAEAGLWSGMSATGQYSSTGHS
jgi:hypothetical protein